MCLDQLPPPLRLPPAWLAPPLPPCASHQPGLRPRTTSSPPQRRRHSTQRPPPRRRQRRRRHVIKFITARLHNRDTVMTWRDTGRALVGHWRDTGRHWQETGGTLAGHRRPHRGCPPRRQRPRPVPPAVGSRRVRNKSPGWDKMCNIIHAQNHTHATS